MLKKMIVSLSIFTTVCGFSAMSFSSTQKDTVVVDHQTVPLRQKADIKRANSENTANIETTNVDYDLRYLFGGEKGYLSFDIWSLAPKSTNSKDTSFKFLCAKPVGKNLYLYVYTVNNQNSDIQYANFKISKSKTQNTETGEFVENFSTYNARFINSYGYKTRFIKFCIDNVIDTSEDVRCFIENCCITYQDTSTKKNYYSNIYTIDDEFAFGLNNGDYMYEYFKNNYVTITDKEVSLLLTDKDITYDGLCAQSAYEDTYCFFNSDKSIEKLLEVEYMYQTITYEVDTASIWNTMLQIDHGGTPNIDNTDIYRGLYNNSSSNKGFGGTYREVYGFTELEVSSYIQETIKVGKVVKTIERPYFLWWTQDVSYELDFIQDCLDTSNLSGKENEGFKTFIEDVQSSRISKNKSKYQWCFKVNSSMREITRVEKIGGWWIFGGTYHSYTKCHEVKQVQMLRLKYRTNDIEFDFNCLDIPTDTSSVFIQEVPFETLGDILVDNVIDWWNWLKLVSNNLFKNIVPFTIAFAVILVVILCWPLITSFMKLLSKPIKRLADKPKKKRKK